MTITTTSTKAVYQGNGATTTWAYAFLIPDADSIIVTLVELSTGNETVLAPVAFSVSGLGVDAGGVVTYPLSGSPLASTFDIVVERFVPEVQNTDLVNQGGAYPADIEDAFDYLTMIAQQLQDQVDRSIVFSVADTVETTLPVADARANKFLGFNSSGDPVAVDGLTAGTTVSAAMIPVVTAVSTAAALTALGIPGSLLDALIPAGTMWDFTLTAAPTGFVFPIGQACTSTYPVYRAALVAAGSPYGTNGVDPLMPDLRSAVVAGKSNMGGVNNGLLTGGTVLGAVLGSSTHTLTLAELPTGITTSGANQIKPGGFDFGVSGGVITGANMTPAGAVTPSPVTTTNFVSSLGLTTVITATSNNTSGNAHSVVQLTFICNKILKVH